MISRNTLLLAFILATVVFAGLSTQPVRAFPSSNQLNVPYHSQKETGAYDQQVFCVPASVEMVFEYISGKTISQMILAQEMNTSLTGNQRGTRWVNVPIPFQNRGYTNVSASQGSTLDELKSLNAAGFVSIIAIWYDTSHKASHAVVVTGYDEGGIRVNDPAIGGSAARDRNGYISNSLLADLWTDNKNWVFQIPYAAHESASIMPIDSRNIIDAKLMMVRITEIEIIISVVAVIASYRRTHPLTITSLRL